MSLPETIFPGSHVDAGDGDIDFDAWTKVVANFAYLAGLADAALPSAEVGPAFVAWFLSLPTTPPSGSNKPWNNGGTLAFTS